MTTLNQAWKPLSDGLIAFLPFVFNADNVTPGELARTCPFADRNETLVVRVLDVKKNGLQAVISAQVIDNKTGEPRGSFAVAAAGQETKSDRRYSKAVRILWTQTALIRLKK